MVALGPPPYAGMRCCIIMGEAWISSTSKSKSDSGFAFNSSRKGVFFHK
jgi:hypothetical protein